MSSDSLVCSYVCVTIILMFVCRRRSCTRGRRSCSAPWKPTTTPRSSWTTSTTSSVSPSSPPPHTRLQHVTHWFTETPHQPPRCSILKCELARLILMGILWKAGFLAMVSSPPTKWPRAGQHHTTFKTFLRIEFPRTCAGHSQITK